MNISQMKFFDRYLGVPLCLALSFLVAFLDKIRHTRSLPQRPREVLLVKFWGMGSIILASDFVQTLRQTFPQARVSVATLRRNREIYEMLGLADEIVDLEVGSIKEFLWGLLKLVRFFWHKDFDIAFDLEFTTRFSAIVTFLSRARQRIGFRYPGIWRGWLFTKYVLFSERQKLRDSFLKLGQSTGIAPTEGQRPALKLSAADERYVLSILRDEGITDLERLIVFNINASTLSLLRRWPGENFLALGQELVKRMNVHIVFIGDRNDSAYVEDTLSRLPHPNKNFHNLADKTSLSQLACLLKKARLLITNDSGPLHLAVHLGCPSVSFFGPETPLIYGPQGKDHFVFYKHLPCSPCLRIGNYKDGRCQEGKRCLKEITVEEVLEVVSRRYLRDIAEADS
jgi:ADP-heptose:LPS heptosyltransferase